MSFRRGDDELELEISPFVSLLFALHAIRKDAVKPLAFLPNRGHPLPRLRIRKQQQHADSAGVVWSERSADMEDVKDAQLGLWELNVGGAQPVRTAALVRRDGSELQFQR